MKKLPYVSLLVTLALVLLNIAVLKQLSRLEARLYALEQKNIAPAKP